MVLITILLAALAATSLMTVFSYIISESLRELYKEPVLLEFLIKRWHLDLKGPGKRIAAWIIHYGIGLVFVVIYYILWKIDLHDITFLSGIIFGIIIGFAGIAGWKTMYAISDYQPAIDIKGYYIQLFFAHIIFGITTFAVYRIMLL